MYLFPTEPKDDLIYRFIESWGGKTDFPHACKILVSLQSTAVCFFYSLTHFLFVSSGNGLFVSKGQKWFRHRRLLAPSFNFDVLKPYTKLISNTTKILLVCKTVELQNGHIRTNSNGEIMFEIVDLDLLLYRFFGVCGSFFHLGQM